MKQNGDGKQAQHKEENGPDKQATISSHQQNIIIPIDFPTKIELFGSLPF